MTPPNSPAATAPRSSETAAKVVRDLMAYWKGQRRHCGDDVCDAHSCDRHIADLRKIQAAIRCDAKAVRA